MKWIKYKGYKEKLSTKQEREWLRNDKAAEWLEQFDKINKVNKSKKKQIHNPPMFEDGDTSGPPPWE